MSSQSDVELELARLKGEITAGTPVQQIECSATGTPAAADAPATPEKQGETS